MPCLISSAALLLMILAAGVGAATQPSASQPALQCGHYAVQHCCRLLGVPVTEQELLRILPVREQGHNMLELAGALERIGLHTQGRKETYDAMCGGKFPIVAHMARGHFVVLERADQRFVTYLDGDGRRKMTLARQFQEQWDGNLLRVIHGVPDRALPDCPGGDKDARIQFETLFIDKGELAYDALVVSYEFPFRNTGKADLRINRVQTSCGCLSAEKPDKPISPGGSAKLIFKYSPNQSGPFTQKAFVETNDPCVPIIELTAAGNTGRTLVVDPPRLDFGKVLLGQTREISCVVRYLGDTPLVAELIACDLPGSSLSQHVVTEADTQALKDRQVNPGRLTPNSLIIRLKWTALGTVDTRVTAALKFKTNVQGFEQVSVPVFGEIAAPVALAPAILSWNGPQPSAATKHRTLVASRDGRAFQVTGVDSKSTGLECRVSKSATSNQIELEFSGTPKAADPSGLAQISVSIRTESGQQFELPLVIYAGSPKPAPATEPDKE